MRIKHGLVSCDSHAQLDHDAFTSRMSKATWGDRIPQVVEVEQNGKQVQRWMVNGKLAGGEGGGVANCPALMENHRTYPQRWEDVPRRAYDPYERLEALDEDGVDGEVLFPNAPVSDWSFAAGGPEYELACVEATNDALAEWRQISDRYIPLAIIPYLLPIETIVAQVERAVERGHRGITMPAEPGLCLEGARSLYDPFWNPLWETCQELGIPVNWHGSAGLAGEFSIPRWKGYSPRQNHTVSTARLCATPTQLVPALMLSGILDRYPRLKFACAETGSGWMAFVLESCDHEWERRHLWTEGVFTRPSEAFRRQVYVDFWFERSGLELRDFIGVDNIMWESDYPHITSTFPNSRSSSLRLVEGIPEQDRKKLLYENVTRLYGLTAEVSA